MQSTHIFSVILVTVILIVIAEYQKLHKIKWILLTCCLAYTLLIVIPEKPSPINDEYKVSNYLIENDIVDETTISKSDSIDKIISDESTSSSEIQNLDISTIAISTDIVEKTPVGVSRLFLNDIDTLFCFTAVDNPFKNNKIIHTWKYIEQTYLKNFITVGKAPYWRCWSRISIRPEMAGDWQVIITDSVGNYLDSIEFSIIPARE
jgi:hypothetical protein